MSTANADVTVPDTPAPDGQPGELTTGELTTGELTTGELTTGELTTGRVARVGDIEVRRLLPLRHRRSVGAWCFVDHYGPMSVDGVAGMQVRPHPHIGLQTVTWLLDGNVLHRDSLGSEQMIRPGQLNLMTAGRGISHAEESPSEHEPGLHGVQLWLALPGSQRQVAPAFEHHPELPAAGLAGFRITVFAGSLAGVRSPATVFSPVVGAQLRAGRDTHGQLGLEPGYEHVIFMVAGTAEADGTALTPGTLLYLPTGRDQVTLAAAADAELFLLGGEPLDQPVVMWWNFVGTTPQDIIDAARDWGHGQRFGQIAGYQGPPLPAPPLDAVRLGGSGVRPAPSRH
jgi:redox-sensitive bicupin YhaK (pirin superfamily)